MMSLFKLADKYRLLSIGLFLLTTLPWCTLSQTNPLNCNKTSFYNILTNSCQRCPINTEQSSLDATFCNCTSTQYFQDPNKIGFMATDACLPYGVTLATNQVYILYNRSGGFLRTINNCDGSAYSNIQRTQCIPCGYGMKYSATLDMCVCATDGQYPVGVFCLTGSSTNNFPTNTLDRVLYGIGDAGCTATNPNKQACQILQNRCSQSKSQFCTLLSQKQSSNSIPKYTSTSQSQQSQSLSLLASSVPGTNTATVKNKLIFTVFAYDRMGRLRDIKPIDQDMFTCIVTQEDVYRFQSFGGSLWKSCGGEMQGGTVFWDIFVADAQGNYVQVMTTYDNINYNKRYYKTPSQNNLQITYTSIPPLSTPYISLTSASPSASASSSASPSLQTISLTSSISITVTVPFIIYNILSIIVFVIGFYKYMKYNPYNQQDPYMFFKIIFIFFLKGIRHWGITLWIWLFGVAAYCFCFFKFQTTIFLLLPDMATQWMDYYDPFMIVFYIQFSFVFVSVGLLIYDLGAGTDYFIVDWEKSKDLTDDDIKEVRNRRPISVWRRIILINQLYELTVSQLLDWSLIVLLGLFLLQGLSWINLSYQIPNTINLTTPAPPQIKKNIVLSYFIITFIFLIIGVIQYIIRHIIKTWYPLPYENYIDLCCISNNSVIIFDHELHGYYIHGMNPLGQAEGNLKYLDSVFQKEAKSFGKSRAFKNSDPDQTQVFQVIYPKMIRDAFTISYKNRCMQKLVSRAADTSILSNPIPHTLQEADYKELQSIQNSMVETFKYYLEGVKTSEFNIKQQSFLQRLLSCPIDSDVIGRLPIFFKDFWNRFTQVLISGHEMLLLINMINFINIFYIATGSVAISCFISLFICRVVVKNLADFCIKRNIARNTLIDDRFFS